MAQQLVEYVCTAPIAPKAQRVAYLGEAPALQALRDLGVRISSDTNLNDAQLLIVGPGAEVDPRVRSFAEAGGRVLVLRRTAGDDLAKVAAFHGSTDAPDWPEAAGLSASDLHWKTEAAAYLLAERPGRVLGSGGQLAREAIGNGVIIYTQVSPDAVPADEKHYFRFTRRRQTRALSQIPANLGATFEQDDTLLARLREPGLYLDLCGTWDVQLTHRAEESLYRQWNGDRGMAETARQLIAREAGERDWEKPPVPAYMESYGGKWRFADGECVFRKTINVPAYLAGKDLFFCLGRVDESGETFINGTSVGKSRHWILPRGHRIPGRLIRAGENVIAIRTWDDGIHGGFCSDPSQLYLRSELPDARFYHDDYRSDEVSAGTQAHMIRRLKGFRRVIWIAGCVVAPLIAAGAGLSQMIPPDQSAPPSNATTATSAALPLAWSFDTNQWPQGFSRGGPSLISLATEDGNGFLRISLPQARTAVISNPVTLDPSWSAITVTAKIRVQGLQRGPLTHETATVQTVFFDADGKQVGGWPARIDATDSAKWTAGSQRYEIPPGATTAHINIGMWNCAGTADFDDIAIVPQKIGELPAGDGLSGTGSR